MTRHRLAPLIASFGLACSAIACGSFRPVQAPRSDLWQAPRLTPPRIVLPDLQVATPSSRAQQDDVTVLLQLLDAERAHAIFGVDFQRYDLQPVLIAIRNDSPRTYAFRHAGVVPRPVPAARVAGLASLHPIRIAAEHVRWLTFLVPGLLVESLIEPLTIDFPGIEEAAQRPAVPNARAVRAEFVRHELSEGLLDPDQTLAGVLFLRPFRLGSPVTISLLDVKSRQLLRLRVPTPTIASVERRTYRQPVETVWKAAVQAASRMDTWRVVSTDTVRHVLVAHTGARLFGWSRVVHITVTVERKTDRVTEVQIDSVRPGALSTAYGLSSTTLDQFTQTLASGLPKPAVLTVRNPAASTAIAPAPARRFGPRSRIERPEQLHGS